MSHPSQVIVDAVAAIEREDWSAFIDLCDPVSLRRFKNDLVWQFSDHGYSPPVTVEDFMSEAPEMPREVAEYNLAQMNSYRDPALRLSLELSAVSSLAELKSLESGEVLIRWLKSRMPRREEEFAIRTWEPSRGMMLMLTALCRRQVDGTWRLIAERNLFFLPQMSIVT
jgi:hypothetical protein